jgi:hypothetical protein
MVSSRLRLYVFTDATSMRTVGWYRFRAFKLCFVCHAIMTAVRCMVKYIRDMYLYCSIDNK